MNIYPKWWDTTITIYNKFQDPQTKLISWYKTTLTNCFWKYTGDKITIGETVIQTSDTICRIPKNENYLDKYVWESLTKDKMTEHFTLGVGDIIIKGEISDIIDEYASGHRSSDILSKYKKLQGCIVVESFSINIGIGRGSEHYFVKGI